MIGIREHLGLARAVPLALALVASGIVLSLAAPTLAGPDGMGTQRIAIGDHNNGAILKPRNLGFVLLPLGKTGQEAVPAEIAEGLTAYLTSDLSRIPGSFVIARASAAAVEKERAAPEAIAARFGVRFVITGSVREDGSRIRLDMVLFDSSAKKDLWSASFSRNATELSALRRDALARIADSIGAKLLEAALPHAEPVPGDLLLRARGLLGERQSAETAAQARRLLQDGLNQLGVNAAVAAPEALSELAAIHLQEALAGWSPAPQQDLQQARELTERAIAADSRNARAQALHGAILRVLKRPHEALAAYEAAVTADSNLADAHAEIGRLRIDTGEPTEALPAIDKALALSPLDPQRPLWLSFAGMAELYADRPEKAIPWLDRAASLDPRFLNSWIWLAAAHELAGDPGKAAAASKTALTLSPGLTIARLKHLLASDDPRVAAHTSQILDALQRAGIPE